MIETLLDRPIAYHRVFVDVTGSVTAAVMLSQAVYWSKRTKDGDGWFWKTQAEWTEETGLSRSEQETARKRLVECGVWEEERRGIPARLFFRVLTDKLECLVSAIKYAGIPHTGMQESSNQDAANPAIIYTEITTENTEETTTTSGGGSESAGLPDDVPFGEVAKTYQNEIGLYSAVIADMMEDDYHTYGGQWIIDAIKVAVAANKRKYNYVRGVLRRWRTEGRQDEQTKQQQDTAPVVVRISGGDM